MKIQRIIPLVFFVGCFIAGAQTNSTTNGTLHAMRPSANDGRGGILVPEGFVAGQGDVGQFIMQTAVHFGKKAPAAKELPLISDQWRYSRFYGLTKPVNGGSISVSVFNMDGHDITDVTVNPLP